jgi:error-prone DNA polymerase
LVKGLEQEQIETLLTRRPDTGFTTLNQLHPIATTTLERLAASGALQTLGGHRYQAQWDAAGLIIHQDLLADHIESDNTQLPGPGEYDNMQQDYAALGLSLASHPIELLKRHQKIPNTPSADTLATLRHQQFIAVVGLVTNRQKPKTAGNATFVTLEDETGSINVVVWEQVSRKYLTELVKSRLLLVVGTLDKDDNSGVTHIIARRLKDLSHTLDDMAIHSRDFH